MNSDSDSSPKRSKKQYAFNPKEPKAYEKLTKHIAAKAKRTINEKNNVGKIVATIAKDKFVSTRKHAISGTFTIDLTDVMTKIQEQINKSIIVSMSTSEGDEEVSYEPTITSSEVKMSKPLDGSQIMQLQVKTSIVFEGDEAEPIDQLARRIKGSQQPMSIKFRTGVASDSTKSYQFEESNVKSKMQTVCCATREMLIKADDVLEGMVYDCLSNELKEKLDEHLDELDKNDEDVSQPGKLSLQYLNQKFGLHTDEVIEMVDKYMEYLSTTKTLDQNLYEYATELKKKLDNLHDAEWSMNNLYLVLILAHSMKSTDVDERGTNVDYSKISEMITTALNKGEDLRPLKIVNTLEKDAKMAKSALKLVTHGTAAEALKAKMFNKSSFDKEPPAGFGFGKVPKALWCAYCAKSKKHKAEGWNGWNQKTVTGCDAHTRHARNGKTITCPFEKKRKAKKTDSSNKENSSLEAKVAQLSEMVAQLAKKQ